MTRHTIFSILSVSEEVKIIDAPVISIMVNIQISFKYELLLIKIIKSFKDPQSTTVENFALFTIEYSVRNGI